MAATKDYLESRKGFCDENNVLLLKLDVDKYMAGDKNEQDDDDDDDDDDEE